MVATLAEMYVQGVSTRKVKAITEELCGHAFSASSISAINKRLDESLKAFAERPLQEPFAYLILDARYEKVREAGIVMSQHLGDLIRTNRDSCTILRKIEFHAATSPIRRRAPASSSRANSRSPTMALGPLAQRPRQ